MPTATAPKRRKVRRHPRLAPLPPAKAKPGDRFRHRLTPQEVKDLAGFARRAAQIKASKSRHRGEKGEHFQDLQDDSGMRHETLLKWAIVAKAFGGDLESLLMELGKTKLYVLAYHPDPRAALEEEVTDRMGRQQTGRTIDAESLRLHIRQKYPKTRRGSWFRKHGERPFRESVQRTLDWLKDDIERITHRAALGFKGGERRALVAFRKRLKELVSSVTDALRKKAPE